MRPQEKFLTNKTSLVTGSTSGIGLGIARSLASAGSDLMIHGLLDDSDGKSLVSGLEKEFGIRAVFSGADLRDPSEIKDLIRATQTELGEIDILVNNAGIQHTSPVESFDDEKWYDILAVNLSAAFHTTKMCVPQMRKQNWGRIINIASVHGLVASLHKAAYCSAKHGIVGLTKVVALELAELNVTCNAICPGWTETELIKQQYVEIAAEKGISIEEAKAVLVSAKQPNKRFASTDQIGSLALYLCSDAAQAMTGAQLTVDGGWTAQ